VSIVIQPTRSILTLLPFIASHQGCRSCGGDDNDRRDRQLQKLQALSTIKSDFKQQFVDVIGPEIEAKLTELLIEYFVEHVDCLANGAFNLTIAVTPVYFWELDLGGCAIDWGIAT
jgi:hypothetical protein